MFGDRSALFERAGLRRVSTVPGAVGVRRVTGIPLTWPGVVRPAGRRRQ